jgi:hypothetical protein
MKPRIEINPTTVPKMLEALKAAIVALDLYHAYGWKDRTGVRRKVREAMEEAESGVSVKAADSAPAKDQAFYIRLNDSTVTHHYWSQKAQNWTDDAQFATIFATREEADTEAVRAEAYGPGEAEVIPMKHRIARNAS